MVFVACYCHCQFQLSPKADRNRGVVTGVDIGIYTPHPKKKSAQVNFLWGKNDVRTAIQQFYTPKKLLYPSPKQISGYAPEGRSLAAKDLITRLVF